jgi:hypothetical protein
MAAAPSEWRGIGLSDRPLGLHLQRTGLAGHFANQPG